MGKPFGSFAESVELKSMSTLPNNVSCYTDTSATMDATFDDVPTYVDVLSPVDDSMITGVGRISGLSLRFFLMV